MALHIPDRWIWDFWFAKDGPEYHVFYLQAPRALEDEELRHWNASVGHAVSQDLVTWQVLPDALRPAAADSKAWDNYTTWTGCVIEHDGLWYMFYTGSTREEKGRVQRVGVATSSDLVSWEKHGNNPVLEADGRWYELLEQGDWYDQAWRDPWVFKHDGLFHAFVTARSRVGEISGRGVIAHATSKDLLRWELQPPVTEPGEFGYLEVPQLVPIGGRWYLFFCVNHPHFSSTRRSRPGMKMVTGTHYLVGDTPLGPFALPTDDFLLGDEAGTRYAGKAIQDPEGKWVFMTSQAWTSDGGFVGILNDPLPLQVNGDGLLQVIDGQR